jgi:hypothetical protein
VVQEVAKVVEDVHACERVICAAENEAERHRSELSASQAHVAGLQVTYVCVYIHVYVHACI